MEEEIKSYASNGKIFTHILILLFFFPLLHVSYIESLLNKLT